MKKSLLTIVMLMMVPLSTMNVNAKETKPKRAIKLDADGSMPRRDETRRSYQEMRISDGVKHGSLNEKEADRLKQGQERVDRQQQRAAKDGSITPEEKQRLEELQDKQSDRISNQRHDDQKQKATGAQ